MKKPQKGERQSALYVVSMENQTPNTPPQRKRIPPKDLILIALAVLVIFRVDWANMNSFHYLILFLLILCFMLRWSNMRKDAIKKQNMERYRAQYEAEAAKNAALSAQKDAASLTENPSSTEAAPLAEVAPPTEEKTEA